MAKPIQATTYDFRDIIEGGFLYVDKTRYLYEMVRYSKGTYFIARPRRFGKSLLISTLGEIFRGNKELFQDLWIYDSDYNWQPYPVIRLDFGLNSVTSAAQLKEDIQILLAEIAAQYGLTLTGNGYQHVFRNLVYQLAAAHNGKVVLLIDEYDKPIIDNLSNLEEAQRIRDTLRALYGVVKALDRYLPLRNRNQTSLAPSIFSPIPITRCATRLLPICSTPIVAMIANSRSRTCVAWLVRYRAANYRSFLRH